MFIYYYDEFEKLKMSENIIELANIIFLTVAAHILYFYVIIQLNNVKYS